MSETVLSWRLDARDNASDAFSKVGKSAEGLSAAVKGSFAAIGVAVGATAAAVATGVGAMIAKGTEFNAEMQNYQAAFTPLLGGADAAKAKLQELSAFAAATPFAMTDLTKASQTMLSFGESTQDLMPDLKMLGDISQGNSEKLSGLALVFGQVQSNGHLMGQDLLQMINQGFNPLQIISEKTGQSMSSLRDEMAKGQISFDQVKQAMVWATSEGGMFYQSMQLGAQTLTGAFSSTKDGMSILSGAMTSELTPALTGILTEGINPLLGGLVDLVNGTDGGQQEVADASKALVAQVQNLAPAIESIASNLSTVFTAIGPAVGAALKTLVGSLATLLPSIVSLAGDIISTLVSAITQNAVSLVKTAVPVLLHFVTGLLSQLPKLLDVGLQALVTLANGIAAALPTLIPAAVAAIIGLVQALINNLPMILDAGLKLLLGLVEGIINALPQLIAALPKIIVSIIEFLVNSIPLLINAGIQLLTALVGALPEIIEAIVKAIPQIIVGIVTALVKAIPQIIVAGVKLLIALVTDLPTIISEIIKAIPQIVVGIAGAFTNPAMIRQLANAGGELIKGLWQGISDLAGWLWSKVSGFFGGLVNQVKGFFGIHSPSTLFRDEVGAMLGQGLADGLLSSKGVVASAAVQLGQSAQAAMTAPTLALSSRSTVESSGLIPQPKQSGVVAAPGVEQLLGQLMDLIQQDRLTGRMGLGGAAA